MPAIPARTEEQDEYSRMATKIIFPGRSACLMGPEEGFPELRKRAVRQVLVATTTSNNYKSRNNYRVKPLSSKSLMQEESIHSFWSKTVKFNQAIYFGGRRLFSFQ